MAVVRVDPSFIMMRFSRDSGCTRTIVILPFIITLILSPRHIHFRFLPILFFFFALSLHFVSTFFSLIVFVSSSYPHCLFFHFRSLFILPPFFHWFIVQRSCMLPHDCSYSCLLLHFPSTALCFAFHRALLSLHRCHHLEVGVVFNVF